MRIKMYENWSRDFVTDFTDNGFDVSEEGETIKGKYNGKFVITGISRWFDDMLAKIETEHKIVKAKTFFNSITGNANFEVSIMPNVSENSIIFLLDGEEYKFNIDYVGYSPYNSNLGIYGVREDGDRGYININITESKVRKTKSMKFGYNHRTNGVFVSDEQISKLIDLITSDKIMTKHVYSETTILYSDMSEVSKKIIDKNIFIIKDLIN